MIALDVPGIVACFARRHISVLLNTQLAFSFI